MLNLGQEKKLTKFLALGLFLITIALSAEGLTDPVNVPKFLLLGLFSIGGLGYLVSYKAVSWNRPEIYLLSLFVVFALVATIRSDSPLTQNLYGQYGRNNGLLTYLFLSLIFLYASLIKLRNHHLLILLSLVFAGLVNLVYCLWVIVFGDFVPWNNPYGNILGTFGNPNFVGSFLGILFGVLLSLFISPTTSRIHKRILFFLLPLTLFEIVDSHAIQGRVLAVLSVFIVGLFYLKSRFRSQILWVYCSAFVVLGAFSLAGALQKGPLAGLIYKTSVSLRGQYWLAAWNTGQNNPISGVGMDSFGDWYRSNRDIRAITLPGKNVVVNAAHNVPLDMFAFGGWPLFLAYLLVMGLALNAVFQIALKLKNFDPVGVGLISAWICYQVQSIISINQIGLAIWGWALSGSLIGYNKFLESDRNLDHSHKSTPLKTKNRTINQDAKSTILVASFCLAGLIISLPPVTADLSIRSAMTSRDASKLEMTMKQSYFNPLTAQYFLLNVEAFEGSGLYEQSHRFALQAVEWNRNSYDLWKLLYLTKNSTQEERDKALINMKKLDPLNPDVTAP